MVKAILRLVRTGAPWRDLPAPHGSWQAEPCAALAGLGISGTSGIRCLLA